MIQTARRLDGWTASAAGIALLLAVYPSSRLAAQQPDTTHPAPIITTGATVVPTDTTHRIRPMGAFLRSFVLPGWGQAATGRRVTGALFVAWEGVAAMMTLKAQSEFHYLRETGSFNVAAKRQEVQDWLVLWVFNHFFSGAEAFVSAHLQDFPKDLKIRAFPDGPGGRGMGIGVSLPLRP
ncbi:MAG TPA: hypothetical protein VEU73_05195 [Gemmatimonadales bacterium]|nr:hypothetical protein [Gemmatimonadales bacterium]